MKRIVLSVAIVISTGIAACEQSPEEMSLAAGSSDEQAQQENAQTAPAPADNEPSPSSAPDEAVDEESPFREVASYGISDSSQAAVALLVGALADHPGLISAGVDEASGQLRVTFTPGETNPMNILTVLTGVEPSVSFVGVGPATDSSETPPGHDCGGCPRRGECQHGAAEDEQE